MDKHDRAFGIDIPAIKLLPGFIEYLSLYILYIIHSVYVTS